MIFAKSASRQELDDILRIILMRFFTGRDLLKEPFTEQEIKEANKKLDKIISKFE